MEDREQAEVFSPPPTRDVLGEHLHHKVTEVLIENLVDDTITVCDGCSLADKITGVLMEMPLKDIRALLQDNTHLSEAMRHVLMVLHKEYPHLPQTLPANTQQDSHKLSLEEIGEILFDKICNMNEPMAAQITGMLLELDVCTLQELISNNDAHLLTAAVIKAKEVLAPSAPSTKSQSAPSSKSQSPSPTLVCVDRKDNFDGKVEQDQGEATKETIGRHLYGKVLKIHPDCASDLTGMILEMDLAAIKMLVGNELQLQVVIDRAYTEWTKHSSHRLSPS